MKQEQNKMGTKPVKVLLLTMGLPMILSMVVQAFYNIVDSYFVSAIGEGADEAVHALTLAFPIQMLMVAVGVGTGIGVSAWISQYLGMNNRERASRLAGNAIFLGVCTYGLFLLFGLFLAQAYLRTQTGEPLVLELAGQYLSIVCIWSLGCNLFMTYEKLLQATGKGHFSTIAQLAGAVANIILDPILIFGYWGLPAMGVAGAAWATVIGQLLSLVLGMVFHHGWNRELPFHWKDLLPEAGLIREIYQIGLQAIVMQALMSFMTYGVNIILGQVSSDAVTAYGLYYKIQQFAFFAAFGLNNAILPLVAYNYGLGAPERVRDGVVYGTAYTVAMMALCAAVLWGFAGPIAGVFQVSEEVRMLCTRALQVIPLGYLFAGANISFQGIFQALGKGGYSLLVSLLRLVVVALPLCWLFTCLPAPERTVWFAFPLAEAVGLIAAALLLRTCYREKVLPLKSGRA